MRASRRAGAPDSVRAQTLERQLSRFRPELRNAAAALAARHARLAELASSFPALFLALARPRARFDPRPVIAGVIVGAPLDELAAAAGVPLWLRRMKPQMLIAPLPRLPDSPFIRHRIVNHFPKHAKHAAWWFEAVSEAHVWAHDGFALWCAKAMAGGTRRRRPGRRRGSRPAALYRHRLLCLWAWHSSHDGGRASALIAVRWQPEMTLKAAWKHADDWRAAVELDLTLGSRAIGEVWLNCREMDGYDFVPLTGAAEIAAEAVAMQNCLRTYGDGLVHDRLRLWSVRRDGGRVATLCVSWLGYGPLPDIEELKLKGNRDAPAELWWTARKWLNGHDLVALAKTDQKWDCVAFDRAAWQAMWKPYWLAKQGFPAWLPLANGRKAFFAL